MDTRELDRSIEMLRERKDVWARMPAGRKAEYLEGVIRGYGAVAARQVAACNAAKGVEDGTPRGGEEWAHPYQTVRLLRLLRETLGRVARGERMRWPKGAVRRRRNGQLAVRVFPWSGYDRALYSGFRGEVWMQPGVTEENLAEHSAEFYRGAAGPGKVALVLGAGNVASVGPGDLAQKLFVEGQVCLFKHNPVVEYLGPILEEAFGALIRDGFVRMTGGGPEVGDSLCRHPGIDEIHLTGSDRTYEAIVFGTGEEGRRRKAAGARLLEKRFTCELGSATPMIVAPGRWSEADIRFHAENIVTQMTVNCGFLCLSTRVLVMHREWPQAGALLDAVRAVLTSEPQRRAYYPAAEARYDEVMAANRSAEAIGPRRPGVLPYTLVAGIDPEDRANPCFATECFLPVLAQTSLPGRDAAEFLRNAVEFCNERLWGTLSASLVVHPETERAMGGAVEEAIEGMRFGTVGVNQWAALGYMWGTTTWGAYPGHTPGDIQSGVGAVHNACLFDRPEKSVVYGPFRMWPKPAWFVTNRQTHHVFRRMFELELEPGVGKAARVVMAAMGG